MKSCGSAARLERKVVEKNRRMHMKSLCSKLSSLVPKDHNATTSKGTLTHLDQLDQAACYIRRLRERVERLKQRKEMAECSQGTNKDSTGRVLTGLGLPVIDIKHSYSNLDVVIISGLSKGFIFHDAIRVLEEEGIEVISAGLSIVEDKIFCTIHSQAISPGIGFEAPRLRERLKQVVW